VGGGLGGTPGENDEALLDHSRVSKRKGGQRVLPCRPARRAKSQQFYQKETNVKKKIRRRRVLFHDLNCFGERGERESAGPCVLPPWGAYKEKLSSRGETGVSLHRSSEFLGGKSAPSSLPHSAEKRDPFWRGQRPSRKEGEKEKGIPLI